MYEILNFDEEQKGKVEKIDWTDIEKVTTAKGSSYKYLDDGRTQRFKKVEGKQYEPQDILVFIPSYEWIIKNNPKGALEKIMGEGIDNKIKFEQEILSYIQGSKKKVYVINGKGKKLKNNFEISENVKNGKQIYITFGDEKKVDFYLPVTNIPKKGFNTFDTRKYFDENTGNWMRERHMGNAVVEIKIKNEEKEQ